MKLPVNPEVVKVYVKFYSLLKKVKEEAWKLLDKIKAEAYEYVQNSKMFMQHPMLQSLLLPLLKTPEDRWREGVKIWPWQRVFLEQFLHESPRLNSLSPLFKRKEPLYTPFGTPVIYGSTLQGHREYAQGASASWM